MNESQTITREKALRAWFIHHSDPVLAEIDGLDIGWGGAQRWATAQMRITTTGRHLDIACGYGTFLAQLGWRFPDVRLNGLNIDFKGPHASIRGLLAKAGVQASLVQADARQMPFQEGVFDSASCFLGLQDIEIGFGEAGLQFALAEAVRVLKIGGILTLLDEFCFEQFERYFTGLPIVTVDRTERNLNVCWNRQIAERAIDLYTEGWVAQARLSNSTERKDLHIKIHTQMKAEMKRQLRERGYFIPFSPVRMVTLRKAGKV